MFAQVRKHYDLAKDPDFKLRDYPTLNGLVGYTAKRLSIESPSGEQEGVAESEADREKAAEERLSSPDCPLAEPWIRCSMISMEGLKADLETHGEAVLEELSPEEKAQYTSYKFEKRRTEWLGGRLAAHRALRAFGINAAISVQEGDGGQPGFAGRHGESYGLTISHSNDWAAAAVWELDGPRDETRFAGIDIERIAERSEGFQEDYFTEAERAFVDGEGESGLKATLLWSMKESALKTLGEGLRLRPDEVDIEPDMETGRAKIKLAKEAEDRRRAMGLGDIWGRFTREGEYIVTLTVAEKQRIAPDDPKSARRAVQREKTV